MWNQRRDIIGKYHCGNSDPQIRATYSIVLYSVPLCHVLAADVDFTSIDSRVRIQIPGRRGRGGNEGREVGRSRGWRRPRHGFGSRNAAVVGRRKKLRHRSNVMSAPRASLRLPWKLATVAASLRSLVFSLRFARPRFVELRVRTPLNTIWTEEHGDASGDTKHSRAHDRVTEIPAEAYDMDPAGKR